MSVHELTPSDFGDTLTGFDEIAIAQRFGRTITEMTLASDFMMSTRALIFVAKRRDGATDDDAWNGAMELPMKGAREYFADVAESEEGDEGKAEEPVLEPPERELLLGSSLSSVS